VTACKVVRGGALGLHGRVGNLLEAYRGGGLTRATCQLEGCRGKDVDMTEWGSLALMDGSARSTWPRRSLWEDQLGRGAGGGS
jgi:hypothetical protein